MMLNDAGGTLQHRQGCVIPDWTAAGLLIQWQPLPRNKLHTPFTTNISNKWVLLPANAGIPCLTKPQPTSKARHLRPTHMPSNPAAQQPAIIYSSGSMPNPGLHNHPQQNPLMGLAALTCLVIGCNSTAYVQHGVLIHGEKRTCTQTPD